MSRVILVEANRMRSHLDLSNSPFESWRFSQDLQVKNPRLFSNIYYVVTIDQAFLWKLILVTAFKLYGRKKEKYDPFSRAIYLLACWEKISGDNILEIFSLFFPENRMWQFMQIFS